MTIFFLLLITLVSGHIVLSRNKFSMKFMGVLLLISMVIYSIFSLSMSGVLFYQNEIKLLGITISVFDIIILQNFSLIILLTEVLYLELLRIKAHNQLKALTIFAFPSAAFMIYIKMALLYLLFLPLPLIIYLAPYKLNPFLKIKGALAIFVISIVSFLTYIVSVN